MARCKALDPHTGQIALKQRSEYQAKLNAMQNRVNEMKNYSRALQEKHHILEENHCQVLQELADTNSSFETSKKQIAALGEEYRFTMEEKEKVIQQGHELTQDLATSHEDVDRLQKSLEKVQEELIVETRRREEAGKNCYHYF